MLTIPPFIDKVTAMNIWVDILRGTLVVLCHSLSLYIMSEPKDSLRHPVAYWIAVSMAAEILTIPMFIFYGYTAFSGGIAYVILLLIYLTAYLYASSGMFLKNFSVFLFYVVFFMLSAAVSDLTVRLAFGEDFPVLEYTHPSAAELKAAEEAAKA